MVIHSSSLKLSSKGFNDCLDITDQLRRCLDESGIANGTATVFVSGSTAAVTTIEYESGAVADLRAALERIAPTHEDYAHNLRWHDGNGFSHVRAALMKPSLTIPIQDGALCLGTWQQVVVLDFDNRPRNRSVLVQIMGLKSDGRQP